MLEETAKVDKNLCKFKRHSTTKTNEFFYADAEKAEERKDQCGGGGYKIALKD